MNNELESKNIIISEVQQLDWGMKIKDERTLVYNVPKVIKSGENAGKDTRAYTDLIALPNNGIGLNKAVKFVTVPNKQGGQSRYVRMITEPVAEGQPSQYNSPAMNQSKPVVIEKDQVNWDDVNFGKCKHQFLLEAYQKMSLGTDEEPLLEIEKTAEKWATMSMRKLDKGIDVQKVAEQIGGTVVAPDGEPDIPVEEMPF